MCDAIMMIYKGNKVLDGTLRQIQEEHGRDVIHVRIEGSSSSLHDLPGVAQVTDFGNLQELRVKPGADQQQLLSALMSRGRVEHFEIAHPSLRDIFMRIAGENEEVEPQMNTDEHR